MGLALPDWRLVHPWALHPGRKPTGPIRINPRYASDCFFASDGSRDYSKSGNTLTNSGLLTSGGCIDFPPPSRTVGLTLNDAKNIAALAADDFTIVAAFRPRAYVNLASIFGFGTDTTQQSTASGQIRSILQFNDNYYFWGAGADWDTGIPIDTDGRLHVVAFAKKGSITYVDFYRDGRKLASTASLTGSLSDLNTAGERSIVVGSGHPSAATGPNMLWAGGALWSRCLPDADLCVITRDFYRSMFISA